MKSKKTEEALRAELAEARGEITSYRLQAEWLAFQLMRRGAKPESEICQYVPEGKCANCAGHLPDCWLEAAKAEADAVRAHADEYVKEA